MSGVGSNQPESAALVQACWLFSRGVANFPNQSRILPKDKKAVILPALKRHRLA
jgi:hypothetical protein